MPEGPEVETIRLGLQSVIGSRIVAVKVANHPQYTSREKAILQLQNLTIEDIERRGKFLVWIYNGIDETVALNHLGMTGVWYHYSNQVWNDLEDPFNKYKHWKVYFRLDDGSHLLFVNIRTFGKFEVMTAEELERFPAIAKLGPDILHQPFDTREFIRRMRGKSQRRRTKEIGKCLLDYSIVAGCGNIYKSEALFRAGIHPFTPVDTMSDEELRSLARSLSEVAHEALELKGSTLKDYKHVDGYSGLMQNQFRVYDRSGKPCVVCNSIIQSAKQAGRTSFWCPTCQETD